MGGRDEDVEMEKSELCSKEQVLDERGWRKAGCGRRECSVMLARQVSEIPALVSGGGGVIMCCTGCQKEWGGCI